jgi:hypothetical protein
VPADTVNAKVIGVVVNVKVVDAGVVPQQVPVTVITALVTIVAVGEADSAKVTVQGAVGVQVADAGVGTAVTPKGRADNETRTGAATPAVVVTVTISLPEAP